jgi:hypothetical protein
MFVLCAQTSYILKLFYCLLHREKGRLSCERAFVCLPSLGDLCSHCEHVSISDNDHQTSHHDAKARNEKQVHELP